MYIISQGSCNVSIYDHDQETGKMKDFHIRKLNENSYFGEISLVYDGVRSATVTCTNYCTLGKISLELLYGFFCSYPSFLNALMVQI